MIVVRRVVASSSDGKAVIACSDEFLDGYERRGHFDGTGEDEAQIGFDEFVAGRGVARHDATAQFLLFFCGKRLVVFDLLKVVVENFGAVFEDVMHFTHNSTFIMITIYILSTAKPRNLTKISGFCPKM